MKNWEEFKLPLSLEDYQVLKRAIQVGDVKWNDLPDYLKLAYNETKDPLEEKQMNEMRLDKNHIASIPNE